MLKKLFLIRHATAKSIDGNMKDIDRPLTANGVRDATHLGQYLYQKDVIPSLFMSSPALRTRQTSEEIGIQIKFELNKISFIDNLYEPSVRELLQEINRTESGDVIILVSHNPSVSYLAEYLTGEAVRNMVPCACLEIDFAVDSWAEVSENCGELINSYLPD